MKILELISDNYYVMISLTSNNVEMRERKRNSQRITMTQRWGGGDSVHASKSATLVESGLSEWNGTASNI